MRRKITVEVRADLLRKAQEASGSGITETVRAGLELMAASRAYAHLLRLKGKVHFSRSLAALKADRRSHPTPAHGSRSLKGTAVMMSRCSPRHSGTAKS